MPRKSSDQLADDLHDVMAETLPSMVKDHVTEQVKKQVPEQVRDQVPVYVAKGLILERQKINEEIQECYMSGHILHVHLAQSQNASIPEQQYQLYLAMKADPQMQQQDITIWLALQMKFKRPTVPPTTCRTPVVRLKDQEDPHDDAYPEGENSAKRYPEAPALSLINQDLLYLKNVNSGPEKIVLSLYKFLEIIFDDDDIEERTFRKQRESGRPKEEIYSNSKFIQVIKTYWELGLEHKIVTEIVVRRANKCIVSITEQDYKNLNKNDIEDMYLLIINNKVPDYTETGLLWSLSVFIRSTVIWERVHDFQLGVESYQQKVDLTAPIISYPGIEDHEVFTIVYEPVHGIIYKNSKKEKRVIRHSEVHKFCDATLKRVLEGLKSYNNDIKYSYVQKRTYK
ncbi:hypothetical protein Tco_0608213 [Tanacetum coccineum]